MRRTVFSTPFITPLLRGLAIVLLKLLGWKAVGKPVEGARFVLIGAPHTSNWDFPLMLMVVLQLRLRVHWMGKHSLFPFPFTGFMKWLGGIPVDRRRNQNLVDQTVQQYRENPELESRILARLAKRRRVRALVLGLGGLIGVFIALRSFLETGVPSPVTRALIDMAAGNALAQALHLFLGEGMVGILAVCAGLTGLGLALVRALEAA